MRILIVDDAKVIRVINRNVLTKHGIPDESILEATNGEAALEVASEHNIDLFLVDWNMPRLDGLGFLKKIREIDMYKETPVVMLTSEAANYNVLEAIEAGATNYLIKPIKSDILWSKLKPYITEVAII